jgi:hypothetical protein
MNPSNGFVNAPTSDKVRMAGNGVVVICRDCAVESIRILESNEV